MIALQSEIHTGEMDESEIKLDDRKISNLLYLSAL